jgi:hypothetical protein
LTSHHWDSPKRFLSFDQYHQPFQKEKAIRPKGKGDPQSRIDLPDDDMAGEGSVAKSRASNCPAGIRFAPTMHSGRVAFMIDSWKVAKRRAPVNAAQSAFLNNRGRWILRASSQAVRHPYRW